MVVNAKKVLRIMREDNLLAQRKAPFLKPPAERPRDIVVVQISCAASCRPLPIRSGSRTSPTFISPRPSPISRSSWTPSQRKAVGWAFENTLDASLAIAALDRAIETRKPQRGSLIHHSDRGVQYASIAYRQILADRDITISMSRPGNPFDNAKAESFMKTLKAEEVNGKAFSDIRDARRRIDSFIADVYNKERLHSALGYQSPLEFETAFAQNKVR